jgi:hypothetical protein
MRHWPAAEYVHCHRYNRSKIPLSAVLQPLNDASGCNVGWTEFPAGNAELLSGEASQSVPALVPL